jgi:hypothetical protein
MTVPSDPRNWSDEGHSFDAAEAVEPTRGSKRQRLLQALRFQPLSTVEITEVAGSEGVRRLRELRQMGYTIVSRRMPGSSQWVYVLLDEPISPGNQGNATE